MTRRKCEVEGEPGYFHTWEHFADTIEASPLVGGAPAGQFSRVYGIVEFEDGSVKRVDPAKIIFKESTKEGVFYRDCTNCVYRYLPITSEPCLSCGQSMNHINWESERSEFERSE